MEEVGRVLGAAVNGGDTTKHRLHSGNTIGTNEVVLQLAQPKEVPFDPKRRVEEVLGEDFLPD